MKNKIIQILEQNSLFQKLISTKAKYLFLGLTLSVVLSSALIFQNCDGGFETYMTSGLSSLSSSSASLSYLNCLSTIPTSCPSADYMMNSFNGRITSAKNLSSNESGSLNFTGSIYYPSRGTMSGGQLNAVIYDSAGNWNMSASVNSGILYGQITRGTTSLNFSGLIQANNTISVYTSGVQLGSGSLLNTIASTSVNIFGTQNSCDGLLNLVVSQADTSSSAGTLTGNVLDTNGKTICVVTDGQVSTDGVVSNLKITNMGGQVDAGVSVTIGNSAFSNSALGVSVKTSSSNYVGSGTLLFGDVAQVLTAPNTQYIYAYDIKSTQKNACDGKFYVLTDLSSSSIPTAVISAVDQSKLCQLSSVVSTAGVLSGFSVVNTTDVLADKVTLAGNSNSSLSISKIEVLTIPKYYAKLAGTTSAICDGTVLFILLNGSYTASVLDSSGVLISKCSVNGVSTNNGLISGNFQIFDGANINLVSVNGKDNSALSLSVASSTPSTTAPVASSNSCSTGLYTDLLTGTTGNACDGQITFNLDTCHMPITANSAIKGCSISQINSDASNTVTDFIVTNSKGQQDKIIARVPTNNDPTVPLNHQLAFSLYVAPPEVAPPPGHCGQANAGGFDQRLFSTQNSGTGGLDDLSSPKIITSYNGTTAATFSFCIDQSAARNIHSSATQIFWNCGNPNVECSANINTAVCGSLSVTQNANSKIYTSTPLDNSKSCAVGSHLSSAGYVTSTASSISLCDPALYDITAKACKTGGTKICNTREDGSGITGCTNENIQISKGNDTWSCQLDGLLNQTIPAAATTNASCIVPYATSNLSPKGLCIYQAYQSINKSTGFTVTYDSSNTTNPCQVAVQPSTYSAAKDPTMAVAVDFVTEIMGETDQSTILHSQTYIKPRCSGFFGCILDGALGAVGGSFKDGGDSYTDPLHGKAPMIDDGSTPNFYCQSLNAAWTIDSTKTKSYVINNCSDPAIAFQGITASTHWDGEVVNVAKGGLQCDVKMYTYPPYPDLNMNMSPPMQKTDASGSPIFITSISGPPKGAVQSMTGITDEDGTLIVNMGDLIPNTYDYPVLDANGKATMVTVTVRQSSYNGMRTSYSFEKKTIVSTKQVQGTPVVPANAFVNSLVCNIH